MVEVIFLQNVEDHKVGDVANVSEGYARNFLFKKGIAETASEEKLKELESKMAKIKKDEAENVKKAEKDADSLKKMKLVMKEEVNEEGHLYGSVGAKEIADAISEKGFEVDGANIEIEEPIKDLGKHVITVKVGHGVETEMEITVERAK